jgi:hypothetical protein
MKTGSKWDVKFKFRNKNEKGRECSTDRGVYKFLVGKPEGKRSLGRPRRRWEDNNEMDLQEVVCAGMD